MYKFRLCFSKTESLRFIGHLDFLRIFQQTIRRAGLPVAYSQGFNPHQQLSFALPLPLGMASTNDYADITLATAVNPSEIVNTLNAAAPQGLHVHAAKPIKPGEGAAAAIISTALYELQKDTGTVPCLTRPHGIARQGTVPVSLVDKPQIANRIEEALAAEAIIVPKKTKSGVKNTDIRPDIMGLEVTDSGVQMLLSAGSSQFLNPLLVAEYLFGEKPCTSCLTRVELYQKDGKGL